MALTNRQPGTTRVPALLACLLLGLTLGALPAHAAGKAAAEAQSIDDLFGTPPAPKQTVPAPPVPAVAPQASPAPASSAAPQTGTGDAMPVKLASPVSETTDAGRATLSGFYQNELAYTYAGDAHWSRFNNTLELSGQGTTAGGIGWKLGGRINYDPIYDLTDYYSDAVRDDQRFEAMIREAYIDVAAGDWEFRLGRQHVVWGEMVGVFVADVVSAKDLRQFVLPDFDMIRTPQWAARAEYFSGDLHAEAVWIPYMTYDDIGVPGAEFYPFNPPAVPGFQTVIAKEDKPAGLDDSAYGARLSWLKNGWDISGFYYTTPDPVAAFSRQVTPSTLTYQPIHERIHQLGGTLGKDLGAMVIKAEAVYTHDKLVSTLDPTDADGLQQQNVFDYIVGLEWSFEQETRLNVQFFQRWLPDHTAGNVTDAIESGASFLFSTQALHPRLEPEIMLLSSLNREDWLARFKIDWRFDGNWRLSTGVDAFGGSGLFGTYANKDRLYTEVRYSF